MHMIYMKIYLIATSTGTIKYRTVSEENCITLIDSINLALDPFMMIRAHLYITDQSKKCFMNCQI